MNKLKIHGVRDTPERSRVWGSRRALSAGTTPPPRGEGRCADGSTRAVRRREGKKEEGGISTRSAIDSVRIQLEKILCDRRESLDSSSILTRIWRLGTILDATAMGRIKIRSEYWNNCIYISLHKLYRSRRKKRKRIDRIFIIIWKIDILGKDIYIVSVLCVWNQVCQAISNII